MTAPPQVIYVFGFKLCEGLASGLWSTVVLGVYVYTLRGGDGAGVQVSAWYHGKRLGNALGNHVRPRATCERPPMQSVGIVMAIQGLMCVLSTLPGEAGMHDARA